MTDRIGFHNTQACDRKLQRRLRQDVFEFGFDLR